MEARALFLVLPLAASILFLSSCGLGRGAGGDGSGQLRDYSLRRGDDESRTASTAESGTTGTGKTGAEPSTAAGSEAGVVETRGGGGNVPGQRSAADPRSSGKTGEKSEGNLSFNLASGGSVVERENTIWFAAYGREHRIYRWNRDTGNCLPLPFEGGEDPAADEIHHLNLLGDTLCFIHGWDDGGGSRLRGVLVTMGIDGTGIRIHGGTGGLTGLAVSGGALYGCGAGGLFLLDARTGEQLPVSGVPAVSNLATASDALFFLSGDPSVRGIYRYSPATGRTDRLPIEDISLFSIQDGVILGAKAGSPGLFLWDPMTGDERLLSSRPFSAPAMITDFGIITWRDGMITLLSIPEDAEKILLEESSLRPQAAGELLFFGTPGNLQDYGFIRMDGSGRIGLSEIVTKPRVPAPTDPEKADFIVVPGLLYHVYAGVRELPGRVRYLEFRRLDGNIAEEATLLIPIPASAAVAPKHIWAGSRSAELAGYLGTEIVDQLLAYDYLALVGAAIPTAGPRAARPGTIAGPAGIVIVDAPFSCLKPEAIQGAMEDARYMTAGLPPRFLVDWKAGRTESGSRQYAISVLVRYENGQGESGFRNGGSYVFSVEYLLDGTVLNVEGEGWPRETVTYLTFSVSRAFTDTEMTSGVDRSLAAETEAMVAEVVTPVLDRLENAVRKAFSLIPVEPARTLRNMYRNGTMICRGTEDSCEYLFSESEDADTDGK